MNSREFGIKILNAALSQDLQLSWFVLVTSISHVRQEMVTKKFFLVSLAFFKQFLWFHVEGGLVTYVWYIRN